MALPSNPPIPFSEPPWLQNHPSPYYTSSHRAWQRTCRQFITENLSRHALQWEQEGAIPPSLFRTFADANMMVPLLPSPLPTAWLSRLKLDTLPGGLKAQDFDYVHCAIFVAELSRCGLGSAAAAINTGYAYGIPPLLKFGSEELQEKYVPDLLTGRKRICIAITEPEAGSDVANITTTAERTADGRHFVVNGAKKWITNGIWSDYATMAVRTGGKGPGGLSLLLVPLQGPGSEGVSMRKIKIGSSSGGTSGTTFITLEDVKVPVGNLIGEEGRGMNYVMTNFNHERLVIAVGVCSQARAVLAAAFAYVLKREAFGRPLVAQPVVRHRLAKAGAELESLGAWVEQIVYSMSKLPKAQADALLGGVTGLAKAKAGMVFGECSQCAVLLFGGNGLTVGGQGEVVQRASWEVMGTRIPGGSEDVLLDLSVRQLVKIYERATKQVEQQGASGSKL